jgi:hypothetical protein
MKKYWKNSHATAIKNSTNRTRKTRATNSVSARESSEKNKAEDRYINV